MKILQFHSSIAKNDAVTNYILYIDNVLKSHNIETGIFGEMIDKNLSDIAKNIDKLKCSSEDVLLIHHSIGFSCFNKIINLPCKKILFYHNITPSKYFDDLFYRNAVNLGIDQTKRYLNYVDYAVADSNFNRKNLYDYGYKNVDILPIRLQLICGDKKILKKNKKSKQLLFVGRIVENKNQLELVKMFSTFYFNFNSDSELFLVGDLLSKKYVDEIKSYITKNNLSEAVHVLGKVSDSELVNRYSEADLFVCFSEHEGFCVPILEAMSFGIPIVAIKSSAVEETLSDAGILFLKKDYCYIAAMCNEILNNQKLHDSIIANQFDHLKKVRNFDFEKKLFDIIDNAKKHDKKMSIQFQGSFENTYSLSLVNRFLAEKMDKLRGDQYDISIFATQGTGDYIPNKKDLKQCKDAASLYHKSFSIDYPDVSIRSMYPPRTYDMNAGLNFFYFGWEESAIPKYIITAFNDYLDGVGVYSSYVADILLKNGLKIPIKVVGCGTSLLPNFEAIKPFKLKTKKTHKFLHISSAFPRKGIDVLIEGFYKAFTKSDDVCLILKTFPNIHNKTGDIIKKFNALYPNHPDLEWIDCDLGTDSINALYKASTCYVHLARGEGFGIPVAEAMLAKIPTIVCNNSGASDFANESTCIPVKYSISSAKTHLSTPGSVWFEPNLEDFVKKIKKYVYDPNSFNLRKMIDNAYNLIKTKFSWDAVAKNWLDFIEETQLHRKRPSVAMVTTWNTKCGIAEYTRLWVEYSRSFVNYSIFPNISSNVLRDDEYYVDKRLWRDGNDKNLNALIERLASDSSEIVHFQFNFGFFSMNNISEAIRKLNHKKIVITFHSVKNAASPNILKTIVGDLNLCSAIIVHQISDIHTLVSFGVKKNIIYHIPHGQIATTYVPSKIIKNQRKFSSRIIIGSYGFFLPHKGLLDVIKSIKKLKEKYPTILYILVCSLYDCNESKQYFKECKLFVENNDLKDNILFVTDFLNNDSSLSWLQLCDLLVAPYHETTESASGAVRFLFAAGRPVITSDVHIFDEYKKYCYQFKSGDIKDLIRTLDYFISNNKIQEQYLNKSLDYISNNNWYKTSFKIIELYNKLLKN